METVAREKAEYATKLGYDAEKNIFLIAVVADGCWLNR